ncbi:MAG: 3-phenylpropionate dioxygenase ferredoxin subunit [Methanocella sp. PtaU1.Bin125]|nr:MAG: 3-phenylpropionate dioxygenase ferredoxin subunit [Methanocella sp. PtaU1.Bin125]
MFRDIAGVDDVLPGGMKAYAVEGREFVLCNDEGRFYAFQRRCGHMNAPLDMGTANGFIITCPLHSVQFDATTGKALSPPVPPYSMWEEPPPSTPDNFSRWISQLMAHVKTCDIETYPVKVEGGRVSVDI